MGHGSGTVAVSTEPQSLSTVRTLEVESVEWPSDTPGAGRPSEEGQ